jgi:hypothetical protein
LKNPPKNGSAMQNKDPQHSFFCTLNILIHEGYVNLDLPRTISKTINLWGRKSKTLKTEITAMGICGADHATPSIS